MTFNPKSITGLYTQKAEAFLSNPIETFKF
ncbi:hypothetical protein DESC_580062 [Desulfosarcina cetonica]|nr:hypothetical protein DESC_580062 [Desulfosarcina cetonica]